MGNRERELVQPPNIDVASEAFGEQFVREVDALLAHKQENNGYLPYGVWKETLRLQGLYPCLEVIVTDAQGNLLLKRREDPKEPEWYGRLHIPGMAITDTMRGQNLNGRLLEKEVIREEHRDQIPKIADASQVLGIVWYDEPERNTTALTLVLAVQVEDKSILQDGFEPLTSENLDNVIEQHAPTITWYHQGSGRPPFLAPERHE